LFYHSTLSEVNRTQIEIETRDQAASETWRLERLSRLIASNFGRIVRCDKLQAVKILFIQFCTQPSIASKLLIKLFFFNLYNLTYHNIFK